MIPPDVASRIQVSADTVLRPVAPTQEISDKLSDLVAGQRVVAQIQALLPNGTYRAMVNQRNITLSLPFSAKSGDSLELLVTQSQGKVALAVMTHQDGQAAPSPTTTTLATLSRAGQLISSLIGEEANSAKNTKATPLNNNQPIANLPPSKGADILPMLRQAISQSGLFYESHQAEWLNGKFSAAALLQEPQGKLSSQAAFLQNPMFSTPNAANAPNQTNPAAPTALTQSAQAPLPGGKDAVTLSPQGVSAQTAQAASQTTSQASNQAVSQGQVSSQSQAQQSQSTQLSGQLIAPQTQAIVQQQLNSLAVQNFVWQGQIWPDQELYWEIKDETKRQTHEEETVEHWQTALRMRLPKLGGIDARIRIEGNQVTVVISAKEEATRLLMRAEGEMLRHQFGETGLLLSSMGVTEWVDAGS